jgi:hypothetical protein
MRIPLRAHRSTGLTTLTPENESKFFFEFLILDKTIVYDLKQLILNIDYLCFIIFQILKFHEIMFHFQKIINKIVSS